MNLRGLLNLPTVFDTWQQVIGAERAKESFVARLVAPAIRRVGARVLELGCGTGALCHYLPGDIDYLGVDLDRGYVEAARRRFPERTFLARDLEDPATLKEFRDHFDIVVVFGVLHHLDDGVAAGALRGAAVALAGHGILLAVEPCTDSGQGLVERALKRLDRGGHIRDAAGYRELAAPSFSAVKVDIDERLMSVPYALAFLTCERPVPTLAPALSRI